VSGRKSTSTWTTSSLASTVVVLHWHPGTRIYRNHGEQSESAVMKALGNRMNFLADRKRACVRVVEGLPVCINTRSEVTVPRSADRYVEFGYSYTKRSRVLRTVYRRTVELISFS